MHERELQHRRALEEEDRRRREIDASRREMSPSRSNGNTPERRGYSGTANNQHQLQYGRGPSSQQQPPGNGAANGKHRSSLTGEEGQPASASAQQQLPKDRKRKVAGSVMLDAPPGRRAVSASHQSFRDMGSNEWIALSL